MVAVPANYRVDLTFQDNRGFTSHVSLVTRDPDITVSSLTVPSLWTGIAAQAGAVAAMSNAKLVKVGFSLHADYAQEPSSETGTYQLVVQKAHTTWGDGNGGFQHFEIPAPKDAVFFGSGSADNNLIVVNPTSSLISGAGSFQAIVAGNQIGVGPSGGVPFSQFFGGQLVNAKPKRRRVLQGL